MSAPEEMNSPVDLPVGSPAGAMARRAHEVPIGAWLAPLGAAANPKAWRPALGRTVANEYVVFIHTLAAPGRASQYTKFPRGVWLAWCRTPPKFPAPAQVAEVRP